MAYTLDSHDLISLGRSSPRLLKCWRIERKDGEVFRFTEDREPHTPFVKGNTEFPSEIEQYTPIGGVEGMNVRSQAGQREQNSETHGVLDSDLITTADLVRGKFRGAQVVELLFDKAYPIQQITSRVFEIGRIEFGEDVWSAELVGTTMKLRKRVGRTLTRQCRHELFEGVCGQGVDRDTYAVPYIAADHAPGPQVSTVVSRREFTVQLPAWTISAHTTSTTPHRVTVTGGHSYPTGAWMFGRVQNAVINAGFDINRSFWANAVSSTEFDLYLTDADLHPDDQAGFAGGDYDDGEFVQTAREVNYYRDGWVRFDNGQEGRILEQKLGSGDPHVMTVVLDWDLAEDVDVADTLTLEPGCDRTDATCYRLYNNLVNNGGYSRIAGQDAALEMPDAS